MRMRQEAFLFVILAGSVVGCVDGADWPMRRADAGRTGQTEGWLPDQLTEQWTFQSRHVPRPAWPRSKRMLFDRAQQPVVAGGLVCFGSSVNGRVTALDLASGEIRWTFFTAGPVRFAPAIWQDRLFVVSDDGYLYALSLKDGTLLWYRRGGPGQQLVLGNERMISKWPARGGPVVLDERVYFAAGIWPSEQIYVYALDAHSGAVLWVNDEAGTQYMPQPHGGAEARSGISAQGYLAATAEQLLVPTGRAVPAALDLATGKLQYFHLQEFGHNGGASVMASGDIFFNGGLVFAAETGERFALPVSGPKAMLGEDVVSAVRGGVTVYRWEDLRRTDRKGRQQRSSRVLTAQWTVKNIPRVVSLVVASDKIIAGSHGAVHVIDIPSRQKVWTAEVDGVAYGLAVADEKLLVSTDRGTIYCFGAPAIQSPAAIREATETDGYPADSPFAKAAGEILARTRIAKGYCLDLDCGDGSLSYELAKRSQLRIVAIDADPEKVDEARRKLDAAGLLGARVDVLQRDPANSGLPRYFANLIVSAQSVNGKTLAVSDEELSRLQRPYGGVVCLGKPGKPKLSRRGSLPGAGNWTHQYGSSANTLCSDDTLVRGKLGMLWFRDVSFSLPSRHGRAPAPLLLDGRLFHEGLDGLIALDAYNGHVLWRHKVPGVLRAYNGDELMGTAGTGSNFCAADGSVYLRHGGSCVRLDAATGKVRAQFQTPAGTDGQPKTWGYISCKDGVLLGSCANAEHIVTYRYQNRGGDMTQLLTESRSLFAMDADTGTLKWHYQAKDSIRHNAIAVGNGKVFLIDRPLAAFDRVKAPAKIKDHPSGRLIALDAKNGKVLWAHEEGIYGTLLILSESAGILWMGYQPTRFRLDSELGGRMATFRAADGEKLWELKAEYASRPILNGETIYAQGGAWDLRTGASKPFAFKRSYGCGILAGSRHMLLFRSATLGYYDLSGKRQTRNYGGVRPGCWVNAIAAGGLVLLPDASAACTCSYLNRAWLALEPVMETDAGPQATITAGER